MEVSFIPYQWLQPGTLGTSEKIQTLGSFLAQPNSLGLSRFKNLYFFTSFPEDSLGSH